jgi:hypothetical protein
MLTGAGALPDSGACARIRNMVETTSPSVRAGAAAICRGVLIKLYQAEITAYSICELPFLRSKALWCVEE